MISEKWTIVKPYDSASTSLEPRHATCVRGFSILKFMCSHQSGIFFIPGRQRQVAAPKSHISLCGVCFLLGLRRNRHLFCQRFPRRNELHSFLLFRKRSYSTRLLGCKRCIVFCQPVLSRLKFAAAPQGEMPQQCKELEKIFEFSFILSIRFCFCNCLL
jgi:hypothetical protein